MNYTTTSIRIPLPAVVKTIIDRLEGCGYEAYAVGGCVRDSLSNKKPKDWDVCTNARPEHIKRCLSGFKMTDVGMRFGTIFVITKNMHVEVTTYRIEADYTDHRRPDHVEYTDYLKEDCKRRDFTVNAMAYHPKKGLIDFFGGLRDQQNRCIRCVGDPKERFLEDALRILRALRLSAILDYAIDEKTKESLKAHVEHLKYVSYERITFEVNSMLSTDRIESILLEYVDVFTALIPTIRHAVNFIPKQEYHEKSIWEHTAKSVRYAPQDLAIRWAMLFHDLAKPHVHVYDQPFDQFDEHASMGATLADETMKRMKFDRKTVKRVVDLVTHHEDNDMITADMKKPAVTYGVDLLSDLLEVKLANIRAGHPKGYARLWPVHQAKKQLLGLIEQNACVSIRQLDINGHDLIRAGIPEGIHMRRILQALLDEVIRDRLCNEKEALRSRALELYERQK